MYDICLSVVTETHVFKVEVSGNELIGHAITDYINVIKINGYS